MAEGVKDSKEELFIYLFIFGCDGLALSFKKYFVFFLNYNLFCSKHSSHADKKDA